MVWEHARYASIIKFWNKFSCFWIVNRDFCFVCSIRMLLNNLIYAHSACCGGMPAFCCFSAHFTIHDVFHGFIGNVCFGGIFCRLPVKCAFEKWWATSAHPTKIMVILQYLILSLILKFFLLDKTKSLPNQNHHNLDSQFGN